MIYIILYFRLKHQILPTLISICAGVSSNIRILHSELASAVLIDYLTKMKLKDTSGGDNDSYMTELKQRLPRSQWEKLIDQLK